MSHTSTNNEMSNLRKTKSLSFISLFTSGGTLICCALPAALVGLGAGAVMSSLVSNVPQLVWFSEHKFGVFIFAGAMLLLSGYLQWQARGLPCPADQELANVCIRTRKTSLRVYIASVIIFLIGGFFAFIAPLIL
ncbi:hypothetical protein [Methylotenera mobilis]|uniref:Mercuric transport protein MerT n=1 Tax=Methylotenera mobilis (strain JLW8 / ATCC BAA-1282 / DSM 17540) TaxID=583345 RepID=C6WXV8_METML|nr:hypothetical protein [Methylotenera mobilis]ACT48757.1 conserved hypothetical protein [Methylotenera mobilis JLW8]